MGCFIKKDAKKAPSLGRKALLFRGTTHITAKDAVIQILSTTAISLSLFQMLPVCPLSFMGTPERIKGDNGPYPSHLSGN